MTYYPAFEGCRGEVYIETREAGLACGGTGRLPTMLRTRHIILIITALLGALLVVRGVWGGVWPVSIQLIAGVLLLAYAGLRWWTMR
jgi:hypothetical protein